MIKVFCVWATNDYGYHRGNRNLVAAFFDESKAIALKQELEMDECRRREQRMVDGQLGNGVWAVEYSISEMEVE